MSKEIFSHKTKYFIYAILLVIIIVGINFIYSLVVNTRLSVTSYVSTGHYPDYPVINYSGKPADEVAKIKRGEYIAKAGDCIACHTAPTEDAKPFAGGLPFQTPFGVIYSPNITPDKETGIGKWTDDNFIKAMHEGISPNGSYYYPAFPYLYFNKITYDDLRAIKAYLNNIPAVNSANKENGMIFPFNWRFLQIGWRLLFFNHENTEPFQPVSTQSNNWNVGFYLVEGAGHCAMCHTPSYYIVNQNISMAAPIRKYNLTGAVVEGYLAPNITKSNLGAIPNEELVKVFTQYNLIGGGKVQGPMAEAVHDSLIHLQKADLLAMVEYLKSVDSVIPKQPDVSRTSTGESIYNNYCSGCHNSGVGGSPRIGEKSWKTLAGSGMDKLYTVAIHGGGNMPARGTCINCTNDEIKAAVDYMVAASQGNQIKKIHVTKTPADGKSNYQKYCSSCHSNTSSKAPQINNLNAWQEIEKKGFLAAYKRIMKGEQHPKNGGCEKCSDTEILSALKYMMQTGSGKRYLLW